MCPVHVHTGNITIQIESSSFVVDKTNVIDEQRDQQ